MPKKIIQILILWAIVTAITGCSYMADYIEGEISNRASFSISARYIDGTGVRVEWSVNPDNDSFAGYEIYMTEEPDNEFADYIVVGARYTISTSPYFQEKNSLADPPTTSFTHNQLPVPGIYFYRVGVIKWDEHDYNNDGKDEKKPTLPNQSLYESYTEITDISGSAMVEIP
ncbi:MAG: hypothetical protein WBK20_11870 [Spirochaetota bacterium]